MSEDDTLVLIVDGQPMSVSRSTLEGSSETVRKCIARFIDIDPDWVPVIKVSLPDLNLPPFFNRHNVVSDPKYTFLRYCEFLEQIRFSNVQSKLLKEETRILACFAIFSDYLSDHKMHSNIDSALCFRFSAHLCEGTLRFARRYHLQELHRKSLATLIRDESYNIEFSCNVSLQEITNFMDPNFFHKISACPLSEIIKYAARIDRPISDIKSDILNQRCKIVFHDIERLKYFSIWFGILLNEQPDFDELLLEYAMAISDCIRLGDD